MDTNKIAIIGPGRLGTALAYIYGRNGRPVTIYYHDAEVCRAINEEHLNPKHLTGDLARLYGGMGNVPRLAPEVRATHDLEQVVNDNDFIFLAITMNRLSRLLDYLRPRLGAFKLPREIVFVSELPTGPTGKLHRARVSPCIMAAQAATP